VTKIVTLVALKIIIKIRNNTEHIGKNDRNKVSHFQQCKKNHAHHTHTHIEEYILETIKICKIKSSTIKIHL